MAFPSEWNGWFFVDGELYDSEQREYYHPGKLRAIRWLKDANDSLRLENERLRSRLNMITSANESFFLEMEKHKPRYDSHMIDLVTRPKY